jgi:hypothetical protein
LSKYIATCLGIINSFFLFSHKIPSFSIQKCPDTAEITSSYDLIGAFFGALISQRRSVVKESFLSFFEIFSSEGTL